MTKELAMLVIVRTDDPASEQACKLLDDHKLAYTTINIDTAQWLSLIIDRSDLQDIPIIFDCYHNLVGSLGDLEDYIGTPDHLRLHSIPINRLAKGESDRLSNLIRQVIRKRQN